MLSQATKVMINQLIEVPTLWGDKKLSIGGRGRCYLDFIDSPNEITPLMIDQSASKTYGTLADMIVYNWFSLRKSFIQKEWMIFYILHESFGCVIAKV